MARNPKRCLGALASLAIGVALQLSAQTAAFDVASIKPTSTENKKRSKTEHSPDSLTMWNVTLSDCVQWAYAAKFYQVSVPDAADSIRYDIRAKTSDPVTVSRMRLMMRDLLATRFQLAMHREMRPMPIFELVVAQGGSKLPAPKADPSPVRAAESLPRVLDGNFLFFDASMPEFAEKLSMLRGIERPVVDKTGISGVFDITLKSAASAILEGDAVSVASLVQQQLGLKLVATKAPIDVIVIDSASKPSEN